MDSGGVGIAGEAYAMHAAESSRPCESESGIVQNLAGTSPGTCWAGGNLTFSF